MLITSLVAKRNTRPPSADVIRAASTSCWPFGPSTGWPARFVTGPLWTSMRAVVGAFGARSKVARPSRKAVSPRTNASSWIDNVDAMNEVASTCAPGLKTMPLRLIR